VAEDGASKVGIAGKNGIAERFPCSIHVLPHELTRGMTRNM
jgi:hypothetical protein